MKNSTQLREAKGERVDALDGILKAAETEGRELSADESTRADVVIAEVEALDVQIVRAQKLEDTMKAKATPVSHSIGSTQNSELVGARSSYDFGKAVREAGAGKLSGLEAEMAQEANREFREAGISPSGTLQIPIAMMEARADTISTSANVIGSEQHAILQGLVPNSVLERAGANRITGVAGSVLLPSLPTDATEIKTEVESAPAATAMSGTKIDPVKMASMITVSNQALAMSAGSFDAVVAKQFRQHSGALIDRQFFENVIANTATTYMKRKETAAGTMAGLTFQNVNGLIAKIGDANGLGDNAKFFGSFASLAEARVTEAVSGSGVGIMQNDSIAGYEALATSLANAGILTDADYNTYAKVYNSAAGTSVTNAASAQPFFLANMDDTYVCYWGGADLIVDGFTSAHLGVTRLIMNVYANAKTGANASAAFFATVPV